jgi:lipopolysaccharide heptosyltransferase II
MFSQLDIYDPRERTLVSLADAMLSVLAAPGRLLPRRAASPPRRILLLRLERIGDLLMSLGAIRAVRRLAPEAAIDLVVGSWNEPVAQLIEGIDQIEILDAPWLSRKAQSSSYTQLASRARAWRRRRYDLAINFEGDIRSHALMALAGAKRRVGFDMAGGGPLLTDRLHHDLSKHTAENSLTLVERAFDLPAGSLPRPLTPEGAGAWRLTLPDVARTAAETCLAGAAGARIPPDALLIAIHPSGGRLVKQWEPERFAEVARRLAADAGAWIVLTGSPEDRPLVDRARAALAGTPRLLNVAGAIDLVTLAAILERCSLAVTGDTGPMHVAAAVGTPIVAIFGPSMPWRYGPLLPDARIVRVDLPCSPCNRIRLPPARCVGHIPDCLQAVTVDQVHAACVDVLGRPSARIDRQPTVPSR